MQILQVQKKSHDEIKDNYQCITKVKALCKAALRPDEFDNYKFWELIYTKGIAHSIGKKLDSLKFKNISREPLFSARDGSIDYFACWPVIDDLICSLKLSFINTSELKSILLECQLDSSHKSQFSNYIDTLLSADSPENIFNIIDGGGGDNNNTLDGYVGNQINFKQPYCSAIMLKILSGLLSACGGLALVLALSTLVIATSAATTTYIAATLGATALLTGIGLFYKADTICSKVVIPTLPNQP